MAGGEAGGFKAEEFRCILSNVTLQTRRRTYWIFFGISSAMLLTGLVFTILLATRRNLVIFLIEHDIYEVHSFLKLRIPSYILSMADVLVLCLFAVVVGALILRTFKKTVSAEIFFFAFWLATLSFESLRLVHLFLALGGGSDSVLAALDKLYIGTRFLGYIAIFISGLYAAGMRNDRQFSIMSVSVGISIALVSILPVNTGIWAGNLMFKVGYSVLIEGFSLAIILITIANYLIAVRVRGDRAYYFIALGIAAIAVGTQYVSRDGSPMLSLVSILAMAAGSFLYIYKIHSFYLWQ
ncbi:MAG: hypothetical protein WA234_09165 [Rectinemataceae bacterium]